MVIGMVSHQMRLKYTKELVQYKSSGIINIYASISFNYEMNEINIYTDAGRCCRPSYNIENNEFCIKKHH